MKFSPEISELAVEARTSRLPLGHGAIPLYEIIHRLPAEVQMVIETPVGAELNLPANDRARLAAVHTAEFFNAGTVSPRT
jgi:hypothetical protein